MIWKTNCMILMSTRLDFDTRKVQKYIKCKEIDLWGGQNHYLCYSIRNLVLRWPILHQSWIQISYDGLENNLNESHVKKAWFWHQEGAKIRQFQGNWSLRGSKSRFMLFMKNLVLRWLILHQSWVQISYDGLENNLNESHVKKAWFWHQEGAKIHQFQGNWSLSGSKSRFMLSYQNMGFR